MAKDSPQGSVTMLTEQLRHVDARVRNDAARQIWKRYFPPLLDLARRHLSPKIRRRQDEEDVLQNMYFSFCRRQQAGKFERLDNRDDLWRMLVMMTLRKTRKIARNEQRRRRDYRREEALSPGANDESANWMFEQMDTSTPTPDEAAALAEELHRRLEALDPPVREIAALRLSGHSTAEIAERLGCSTRNVERRLRLIRETWIALA